MFKEWDKFQVIKFIKDQPERKAVVILEELGRTVLMKVYALQLKHMYAEYTRVLEFNDKLKKGETEGYDKTWCRTHLPGLESGKTKYAAEPAPKEVLDILEEGIQAIKKHYVQLEVKRIQGVPFIITEKQVGAFGSMYNLAWGIKPEIENFLNLYNGQKDHLLSLLDTTEGEIETVYKELCEIVKENKGTLATLKDAYEKYHRSRRISPLVTLVYNKKKLSFDTILPNDVPAKDNELEIRVNNLLKDLNEEKGLHLKGKVTEHLEKSETELLSLWNKYLTAKYPLLSKACTLIVNGQGEQPNIWNKILEIPDLTVEVAPVEKKYKELLKGLDARKMTDIPFTVTDKYSQAMRLVKTAFAVWEADRILNFEKERKGTQEFYRKVLGLPSAATPKDKKARYDALEKRLLLKNQKWMPEFYKGKLEEASKLLSKEMYSE